MNFNGVYQDVKIGDEVVHKGRECEKRLEMILPYVKGSVLDVGSHSGYFSIELARRGYDVVSYERETFLTDIHRWALKENGIDNNKVINVEFDPSRDMNFDTVLLLAVVQYYDMDKFIDYIRDIGKRVIIEFPTPDETEALYIDKIKATHPFDKYLKKFFSKVELIGEPEAPYMKGVKRKMWLCEK